MPETFDEFKDSFSYGSRVDLTFKFLKLLPGDEAAALLAGILAEVGALLDDGDPERVIDMVVAAQAGAYRSRALADRYRYGGVPFTRPDRPVAESTVVLLTSSGHFVAGADPRPFGVEAMTQEEAVGRIGEFVKAAPVLSTIPVDTPAEHLAVRHAGYDIRGALADPGVAFPSEVMRELEAGGRIGSLLPDAYSFVGAAAQGRIVTQAAPAWAEMLADRGADVALLVPL